MADIPKMRVRAGYLREQAKAFREMGERAHDDKLRAELFKLAATCQAIADKIDTNITLGVHQQGQPDDNGRVD